MKKKPEWNALRVSATTREKARRLAAKAARDGWRSLGIDQDNPATMVAVVEAGIALLEDRAARRKCKK